MSAILESVLDPTRKQDCTRNDTALAHGLAICTSDYGRHTSNYTLRFARTSGEGFRDASYATPFEHHLSPGLWVRVRRFFRSFTC